MNTAVRDRTRRHRRPAELRSVFGRSIHDVRTALIGWVVGLAVLAAWLLAVYPTIHNNDAMKKLLESYPAAMRAMFHLDDFTTGPGYLRSEVFSFTAPVLLMIVAVFWGSDAVAGEEERNTIDLLLANPISRRRVAMEKWAAALVSVALVCSGLLLALLIGAPIVGLEVGASRVIAGVTATFLLASLYASIAFAFGAATGRRGLARGVGVVLAVTAYLVSSLAELVHWLRPLRPLSPWHHALGVDPVGSGLHLRNVVVLIGLTAVVAAVGVWRFEGRDLVH